MVVFALPGALAKVERFFELAMNIVLTLRILGALLLFLAAALLVPLPFSLYFSDGAAGAFLLAAAVCGRGRRPAA